VDITHKRKSICIACGNEINNKIHHATENMFGMKDSFTYLECAACESLQITEVPENLSKYYPTKYYAFGNITPSKGIKNLAKRLRWFIYARNLYDFKSPEYLQWMKKLKVKNSTKIADIGCGNGQLVYELHKSGFSNMYGFDPFLGEEITAHGFFLQRKALAELVGKYDVLMMHHSFEHIENPHFAFQVLEKLSIKGSKLLLRMPLSDGWAWKNFGVNWFQLDAPRHLFIPSKKALLMLAEKYGFKLTEIIYDSGANQFWGPELYQKGLPYHGTPLDQVIGYQKLEDYETKAQQLNREDKGDQACFYFEKL